MAGTPDAAPDLGILLTLALRAFTTELHAGLDARGFGELRPPFGVVFRALRDEPLTLTELAARLAVTKQAASKVVDEMVEKMLVDRSPSATDARAKLLALTRRGRRAMATAGDLGAVIDSRLREQAGPTATDAMYEALTALITLAGLGPDLARRRSPALWDSDGSARRPS